MESKKENSSLTGFDSNSSNRNTSEGDLLNISIPTEAVEQILTYKSVGELKIELYFIPPSNKIFEKAPIYFIIPGGGWYTCDKKGMINFSSHSVMELRKKGFAVVSIDYRVNNNGFKMHSIISDCIDAARYLSKYKEVLEIDTEKIVTSGHSAGGHLALMMLLANKDHFVSDSNYMNYDFNIIGSAAMAAPTMLFEFKNQPLPLNFSVDHLMENGSEIMQQKKYSPIEYANKTHNPILLIHGKMDPIVYVQNATLFADKCKKCGCTNTKVILVDNAGHSFESLIEGESAYPSYETIQTEIVNFAISIIN